MDTSLYAFLHNANFMLFVADGAGDSGASISSPRARKGQFLFKSPSFFISFLSYF